MWGATDYKLTADWLVEQQIDVQRIIHRDYSPHSSCLCLLTLLVCVTSLFLSVSPHSSSVSLLCLCLLTLLVCVTSLFLSVSPHSSCLCHLTLLVCVTSLFLSVSPHSSCLCLLTLLVCVTSLFLSVISLYMINEIWSVMQRSARDYFRLYSAHTRSRNIFCLFTFLLKERELG